jgi:hypothetical protein
MDELVSCVETPAVPAPPVEVDELDEPGAPDGELPPPPPHPDMERITPISDAGQSRDRKNGFDVQATFEDEAARPRISVPDIESKESIYVRQIGIL